MMKKMPWIVVWNIGIMLIVTVCVLNYTMQQTQADKERETAIFAENNDILTEIVDDYIADSVLIGGSWARALDTFDYDMQSAMQFLEVSQTEDQVYGAILWEDTLEGFNTARGADGNYIPVFYGGEFGRTLFTELQNEGIVHITQMYTSPATGRPVLAFYERVRLLDEHGKKKNAIVLRICEVDYLRERWTISMGNYEDVVSVLIQKDGDYIVSPAEYISNNLFESIGQIFPGINIDEIQSAVDSDGAIESVSARGNSYYFTFDRVSSHDGWYVVSYVPSASLTGSGIDWTIPLIVVAVLVVLLSLNMLYFWAQHKRDKAISQELTQQVETIEHQQEVLREALETAKSANAAKNNFLSNMSHDIRTPMNAIVGLSVMLAKDASNEAKVLEHTKKITASAHHLLNLINDILDMSKIESGKTSLNLGDFSLAEVVSEIEMIIRPQAKNRSQTFEISLQNLQNENLVGDKLRINEILINLLSNAVKYTEPNGEIHMRIEQLPYERQNFARFRFIVSDNGIGMSEEYQKVIFEPFTREDDNKKIKMIRGTGLGMAITKELVGLMGGTISLESELGKGSTFTVQLDLRIQETEIDHDFWKKHDIVHTLVVDDEEYIFAEIQEAMKNTGVDLRYAKDGYYAVSMTKEAFERDDRGFDLILLDWKMPEMDGLETCKQIRRVVPKHIPIMILTAYDMSDIEEEAFEAGIDGFLQKPFFLSNFMQTIDKVKGFDGSLQSQETAPTIDKEELFKGRSFLVAEDNEMNAEIISELMDMAGATVYIAENGELAVEKFKSAQPGEFDAIFMDVQMPVMNGYEAARAIRACDHPEAKDVLIIAMTANAFAEDVKEALDAGMNVHVSKPIDLDRLAGVLSEYLPKTKKSNGENSTVTESSTILNSYRGIDRIGYGVTPDEKKLGLAHYNHALFNAQAYFTDFCWEVDLLKDTAVIMIDKINPDNNQKKEAYTAMCENFGREYAAEPAVWMEHLSINSIQKLKEGSSFEISIKDWETMEEIPCMVSIAPYFAEDMMPKLAYICLHKKDSVHRV